MATNKKVIIYANILIARPEECKLLERFLFLDAENANNLQKLLPVLLEQVKEQGAIERTALFYAVYGEGIPFSYAAIGKVLDVFLVVLEDFFAYVELKKNPAEKKKKAITHLRANHKAALYLKLSKELETTASLEDEGERHLLLSQLTEERYFYELAGEQRDIEDVNKAIQHLNTYYAIHYLKNSIERLIDDRRQGSLDEKFMDEIRLVLSLARKQKGGALLEVLVKIAEFYLEPSEKAYFILKNYFLERFDSIESEKQTLYRFIINAIVVGSLNPNRINEEYFFWYTTGEEKNIIVENNYLDIDLFYNITYIAYKMNEYDWLQMFTKKNKCYLVVNETTKTRVLNQVECYVLFGQKNYEGVIELLKKVKTKGYGSFIHKNILLFKSIYELSKENAFYEINKRQNSFSSSLGRYYNLKKINQEDYEKNMNFIKLLRNLADSHWNISINKAQLLKELEFFQTEIIEYKWLKEKIENRSR